MEYKLFDDFITLQALLKELGIIQSGGAIKGFLANNTVLFNGELENRRGKKIRLGDVIELPDQDLRIELSEPSDDEKEAHLAELAEKERVASLVKKLNKENRASHPKKTVANKGKKKTLTHRSQKDAKPVRFPGT